LQQRAAKKKAKLATSRRIRMASNEGLSKTTNREPVVLVVIVEVVVIEFSVEWGLVKDN
jgi:hypothetical protein